MLGLFINGVADMELQHDFLAEQGINLDKATTMAVARDTAKHSQEMLDSSQQQTASIYTYRRGQMKVMVPPDCCACCVFVCVCVCV